jgi:hypothetical protein
LSYRVITSDYKMSQGSYEPIDGTEECVGEGYNYRDAHLSALQNDTKYKLAWYEKLENGIWYNCDSDGKILPDSPAYKQEIPFSNDCIDDMKDHPEDYNLQVDSNGDYIIPTKSVPKK